MRIEVTAEDIAQGSVRNPFQCPVALALKRAINNPNVSVGVYSAYTANDKPERLPVAVTRWITDFDSGRGVQPFNFELPDVTLPAV